MGKRILMRPLASFQHVESLLVDLAIFDGSWAIFVEVLAGRSVVVDFVDGFEDAVAEEDVGEEEVADYEAGGVVDGGGHGDILEAVKIVAVRLL